jgi:prepilin-type N-terminal cleavage/methylation domain-containing protein/prepilin-type processing-associated H-X9-DG protein
MCPEIPAMIRIGQRDSDIPIPAHQERRSAGFTLVELLVVVSIIALLISILLPSLRNAREQAKTVKCLAHSRGLGQAMMTFASDHGGYTQIATNQLGMTSSQADPSYSRYEYGSQTQTGSPKRELIAWPVALAQSSGIRYRDNWKWGLRSRDRKFARDHLQYIDDQFELAICPSDKIKLATPYYPVDNQMVVPGNPNHPSPGGTGSLRYYGLLSYGINEDINGTEIQPNLGPGCWKDGNKGEFSLPGAGRRLKGRLESIFDPASVIIFADAGAESEAEEETFANMLITAQTDGPMLHHFQERWSKRMPEKRHPKRQVNITYGDGHGGAIRPTKFKTFSNRLGRFEIATGYSGPARISPYPPRNMPPGT